MSESVKVPYYCIYINGVELDEYRMNMLESIVFEDTSSGSDLLTLTFYDPDLVLLSDNIFVQHCNVSFIGGWYKGDTVKFEGFISVIDIDFPENGTPSITLNCMDNTHIMNVEKKKRTWENTKVSTVASQIFREYGFKAVVDDTGDIEENISQSDTDIKFLIQQASDQYENFIVYVEGTTGYFVKKPNLGTAQATLQYREGNGDLISFSPRINKQTKQLKVSCSEVNTKDNAVDTATTNDTVARPVSGETINQSNTITSNSSSSSGGSWVYQNGTWVKK